MVFIQSHKEAKEEKGDKPVVKRSIYLAGLKREDPFAAVDIHAELV